MASVAVFLGGSWCDLAKDVGISLNVMLANLARECLEFEVVAQFRGRHAPG
jgi:hypothetical protein